jgi:hypothetical protein
MQSGEDFNIPKMALNCMDPIENSRLRDRSLLIFPSKYFRTQSSKRKKGWNIQIYFNFLNLPIRPNVAF